MDQDGMRPDEVLALLTDLAAAGCRVWVAGGWGVDALLGRQTRAHRDLDLAVDSRDEAAALAVLAHRGYVVETDWRPVRVELVAPGARWVDLHPVVVDDVGHGRQAGLDGGHFDYPPTAFDVGSVGGRPVPCLSREQQVAFHRGYEPRPVDLEDLRVLEALATTSVLRPMAPADLDAVLVVQREGAVVAFGHVFPQETHPFPTDAVRARWQQELADPGVDCFVVLGAEGQVAGFAAVRGDELLHFGTALESWGSGLARRAHDELVGLLAGRGLRRARLRVLEANLHARHFYEHRGWTPDGGATSSPFAPYPVLLGYERELSSAPGPSTASSR